MKKSVLSIIAVFTISLASWAQSECEDPVISQVTGGGTYCPDEEVELTVTGDLNGADEWSWYSGSCGGQVLATGTTLTVSVSETETYFVRGTGGCVNNSASCFEIEVKLDDLGPEVVTGGEDITVENEAGTCEATVEFEAPTGQDNCSEEITIEQVEGPGSGSVFPVGETTISYELTDALGNVTLSSFVITVVDAEAPQIECPQDIDTVNDPGECGAIVTYDVPVGTDNCDGAITELTEGLGSGAFFPVGTTVETYRVTDASGNTTSCSFSVTVRDVEPPVITVSDKVMALWPPNHKHHEVEIADHIISVSDNCGGVSIEDVVIEQLSSDEPNNGRGDGNTVDDIVISDDCRRANLLAERSGSGNGRVYRVGLALMDLHGNVGRASFITVVPHDMSKKKEVVDDGELFTVTGCTFEENEVDEGNTGGRVEMDVNTFPNPFAGSLQVDFVPRSDDNVTVELYNLMGRKVADLYRGEVTANNPVRLSLDPPSLDNDIYLLVIWGNNSYGTTRVIYKR